ncbi:MAG: hypothetical protein KGQ87_05595 [Verrucomicrobia bacterium]|nr:hypothetical protein [Verrucomicrobiota bacterium]
MLYHGCCEPVENRLDYIRQAPNLRGVSASPWADVVRCAEACGRDYVLYCKPNPSRVAVNFAEEAVKADLDKILAPTAGNNIAVILKDLHTVSHDLGRYRRWSDLAREAIRKHRKP